MKWSETNLARCGAPAALLALWLPLAGFAAADAVAAQEWRPQVEPGTVEVPKGDLFIRNLDAAWTATGETLEGVSILIRDGRIAAIGPDLSAPDGVETIEGAGLTAIPGIVDEHSHIAMESTNEGSAPVVPEVRVIDALDPDDFGIYRALSGGVTTAQILHGSSNPIGGQSAIIKTRWGMDDARKLLVQGAPQTVKFALGENVTRKNSDRDGPTRFPASREGVEATYVAAFEAARAYRDAWNRYRESPDDDPVPPRRDLRLEALVDIMEGRIRVHAHSYRSDEIVMLMRVAERFGFRIDVFTHVLEGYKVADEMAAHGAGGSTFSDWWQYKLEAYDAIPYNAAIMHEHGVLTTLNSDIPWLQTFLREEMSKPVKYGGVEAEEALRMLTLYPARQLRIDDRVGSLEVGKDGDLVLLSGHPFNTFTRVVRTIIDGIVYYDLEREEETRGEPVRALPADAPRLAGATAEPPAALEQDALPESARPDAPPLVTDRTFALIGATVHPVAGPSIQNGVVVVEDGRIAAVGAAGTVPIPESARRVDLTGKHLYPGLIDAITQMGMVEIGSIPSARDDFETGDYNPHIHGLAGVHPHTEAIPVARANGVLATLAVPASGVIQGAGSLVQLAGDTPERMLIQDRAAIVVNFPEPSGDPWEEPKLEGAELEELIDLFRRARLYGARPTVREAADAPFDPNVRFGQEHLLSALVPAITGEVPVLFRARREREIRTLLMVADSFPEMRPVIVGGDQAFRVADELARRDIPVIVGSGLSPTMDRDDPVSAGWRNAGILHAAGVEVAFGTNDVADVRNLPYHAARSVAYGLPRDEAIRALTLNAAEILGVADRMGSIEVGKRADLIVTDGDPLQIVTHVDRAFIDGREVRLSSKHTELYLEFKERRGRATTTTRAQAPASEAAGGGSR
ncbi:MAG: amidohydrolase family protein [Gemmatimonadota bacterium]